ncbi:MAG TPA: hypothetical protein VFS09_01760 [Candidatus Eisenbacteria bacterium]|nr:hypothetical protein [Candidatus Eisenbacteria bacterium]
MKLRWLNLISMAAMAPLAVNVSPTLQDSSVTSLTIAMGSGDYAYVTRGCDNEVISANKRHFRESAIALNHDFKGAPELGVRATILNEMPEYEDGTVILNPYGALEGKHVGFGIGYVSVPDAYSYYDRHYEIVPASGHLRFGRREGTHFSMHLNEDLPLTSGGGAFRMGVGFRPARVADIWLGSAVFPYDRPGFVARADIHATRFLDLHATGRLGGSEGVEENAFSLGATFKLTH